MIKVKIRNLEQVKKYIDDLPRNVRGKAVEALAEWFIGNGQRGLKRYPSYKWITRKAAYGQTFVSDKQRRYVMARIREGSIDPGTPHRTMQYQNSWNIANDKTRVKITNSVPYAKFVGGDNTQARLNKKVGWRTISEIIGTNIAGAIRHANSKLKEWLK